MKEYIIQAEDNILEDGSKNIIEIMELVRCIDCRHCERMIYIVGGDGADCCSVCYCEKLGLYTHDNWFCADGERRTDDA